MGARWVGLADAATWKSAQRIRWVDVRRACGRLRPKANSLIPRTCHLALNSAGRVHLMSEFLLGTLIEETLNLRKVTVHKLMEIFSTVS